MLTINWAKLAGGRGFSRTRIDRFSGSAGGVIVSFQYVAMLKGIPDRAFGFLAA